MRIGAIVRSYGLTDYLPAVLRNYSWVEKIMVMNYRFPKVTPRKDDTIAIASKFKNVDIRTGDDLNQHDVFNRGLELLSDFDYVFISDNDEIITRNDQDKLLRGMEGSAAKCNIIDYARDFEHRFPKRDHQPVVLVKPDVRFYEVRCLSGNIKSFNDVELHHFGYVYKPEDISWKVNWEKPWEHDSVITLLGKVAEPYQMPEEVREILCEQ